MANKALKSIKFPGLNDTYTIPQVDNTLAVSGAAADAKKTGDAIGDLKSAISDSQGNIIPSADLKSALYEFENTQMEALFAKASVSGTTQKAINVSIPAGQYVLKVGNLVASDTSQNYSRIKFYDSAENVVLSVDIARGTESTKDISLSANVSEIIFYGKNQYNDSTGVTFTYSNVAVLKDTGLSLRLESIENDINAVDNKTAKNANDIADIYNYQTKSLYNNASVSGTRYKAVSVSISSGSYILDIDEVDSTDQEYTTSRFQFYTSDNTLVLSLDIKRSTGYHGTITLNSDVAELAFYGAHSYADSANVVFEFKNVRISENTNLNRRFEEIEISSISKINNPYHDVLFAEDELIKTTTHDHCGQQTVLDRLISKNLDAIAISNYYPSAPKYTLAETGLTPPTPPIIEIPNAEQHGFTNTVGACHINSIGSMFSSGKPVGQTPVGVNDTWQNAIIKIKRQFMYEDGGGISINHPVWSQLSDQLIFDMLDFDPVVLGIEIYNQDCEGEEQKGWALDLWDRILKTGRRCFGFAVPDHYAEYQNGENWNGTVKIFVPEATQEDILRSIRNGAFYCQINHTDLALSNIVVENDSITITANKSATIKAIIDGEVAKTVTGTTMTVDIPDRAIYARFEIITADDSIYTNPIMYKTRI